MDMHSYINHFCFPKPSVSHLTIWLNEKFRENDHHLKDSLNNKLYQTDQQFASKFSISLAFSVGSFQLFPLFCSMSLFVLFHTTSKAEMLALDIQENNK